MKYAVVAVLLIVIGFMADRLAREENQRNALATGACPPPVFLDAIAATEARDCLARVQSRPSWLWQVYEGLFSPLPPVSLTSPD